LSTGLNTNRPFTSEPRKEPAELRKRENRFFRLRQVKGRALKERYKGKKKNGKKKLIKRGGERDRGPRDSS